MIFTSKYVANHGKTHEYPGQVLEQNQTQG